MDYTPRTFKLPATEGISEKQLSLHIGLYEGYVKHVNVLLNQMNALAARGEEFEYTVSILRRRLGFEWNGMRLHELYFEALEGGARMLLADTPFYQKLAAQYGGYAAWLDIFAKVGSRGPGWSILNYDPREGRFFHTWVADHEMGHLATLPALLVVDHWEHAYLLDYKPSEKDAYVRAYLGALNWQTVAARFDAVAGV